MHYNVTPCYNTFKALGTTEMDLRFSFVYIQAPCHKIYKVVWKKKVECARCKSYVRILVKETRQVEGQDRENWPSQRTLHPTFPHVTREVNIGFIEPIDQNWPQAPKSSGLWSVFYEHVCQDQHGGTKRLDVCLVVKRKLENPSSRNITNKASCNKSKRARVKGRNVSIGTMLLRRKQQTSHLYYCF